MRTRYAAWMAMLGLAVLSAAARAEERKAPIAPPTVIARVKSLDGLIADVFYLAEVAGKTEEVKQGQAFLQQFTGPKGVEGFDTKKPFGLYGKLGPNGIDSEVVVLLPIADEESALAFLHRFIKSEKGEDGVYTVNLAQSPFPLYFRFANGYAYATVRDKDVIDKAKLLRPASLFAPNKVGTLSATINLDQIPKQMKQMVIGQSELQAANEKEKAKPGETEAQRAFRSAVLDEGTVTLKQVLDEGGPIDVRLDINKNAGKLSLVTSLAGVPDSKLARNIAALAKARSVVSGLVGANSAMNVLLHVSLPSKLRKALEPVIEEGMIKGLKQETDENKRKLLELGTKAILPTLKAAELDAAFSIRGPGAAGKYALIMGLKVQDGENIEKAMKVAFKDLPKEEQKNAQVDFAEAGGVNIHQIKAVKVDDKTKEMLGDGPMYLAVRKDAAFIGGGENGLQTIKDAIGSRGKAAVLAQLEISWSRFAPLMGKDTPGAVESAKKAFAKDPKADKMRLSVTGGNALTARFSMDAPLIHFFALIDEARKKGSE